MQRLLFFFILINLACFAQAQWSLFINFEDTSTVKYAVIDTAYHGNIWQIGEPSKTFFTSAYSIPKAIVTDTILPYPINNRSSFTITISNPEWFWGSPASLKFFHKYNTSSNKDGGYIEVSYDSGVTWKNIIYDSILTTCPYAPGPVPMYSNIYSSTDTITEGIPAFNGNSNGWIETRIDWFFCIGVENWPPNSVSFRFVFLSDSLVDNKDGWIIDNIFFNSIYCSDIKFYPPTSNIQTSVFPIPAVNELNIKTQVESTMEISNIQGQIIMQRILPSGSTKIDINRFVKGVYMMKLNSRNKTEVLKIIKD